MQFIQSSTLEGFAIIHTPVSQGMSDAPDKRCQLQIVTPKLHAQRETIRLIVDRNTSFGDVMARLAELMHEGHNVRLHLFHLTEWSKDARLVSPCDTPNTMGLPQTGAIMRVFTDQTLSAFVVEEMTLAKFYEAKNESLREENESLREENESLHKRCKERNKGDNEYEIEMECLESQLKKLQQEIKILREENESLREENESLHKRHLERNKEHKMVLEGFKAQFKGLQEKYKEKIMKYKKEIMKYKKEFECLEALLATTQTHCSAVMCPKRVGLSNAVTRNVSCVKGQVFCSDKCLRATLAQKLRNQECDID